MGGEVDLGGWPMSRLQWLSSSSSFPLLTEPSHCNGATLLFETQGSTAPSETLATLAGVLAAPSRWTGVRETAFATPTARSTGIAASTHGPLTLLSSETTL